MEWRKAPFIVGLQVIPNEKTACDKAYTVSGHYKLEDAPDFPFLACTELCCTCTWQCVFDNESEGVSWLIPERRHPLAGGKIEVPPEPLTEESIRSMASILNNPNVADAGITEKHIQRAIATSKWHGTFEGSKPAISYLIYRFIKRLFGGR